MPMIALRISEGELNALDSVARTTERTRTYILKKALYSYLEEYVDYQIALDRFNDKDDPIISSNEMRRLIGVPSKVEKSTSKELKNISPNERAQVFDKIEQSLSDRSKRGRKLKGKFADQYRRRIGDYRVIYTFIPEGVLVLRVRHRKEAYKK